MRSLTVTMLFQLPLTALASSEKKSLNVPSSLGTMVQSHTCDADSTSSALISTLGGLVFV